LEEGPLGLEERLLRIGRKSFDDWNKILCGYEESQLRIGKKVLKDWKKVL
jgi:hypothetical protein